MTKSVLITGGTGYIGGHVAKYMKQQGYRVAAVDLIDRGHVTKYLDTMILGDYAGREALNYIRMNSPDAIVHCAGTSLVGPSVADPATYYHNNVAKSINFFKAIVEMKQKPTVVFSSSASVYGNPMFIPITEEHRKQPISPYGQTKAIIEQILHDFSVAYGLKSVSLRYFNACGADLQAELGQEPNATHIIARLLEAKLRNKMFVLNGTNFPTDDGSCVRDYVHVWDLARAHYNAIEYIEKGGETCVLNLGTNRGYSNTEIVNAAQRHVGEINIKYGEAREGDPALLIADATKAHQQLAWVPEHSDIDTIIESAWKWYTRGR